MKKLVFVWLLVLCAWSVHAQPLVPQNSVSNTAEGFRTWYFNGGYKVGSGPSAGPAGTPMVNAPYNPQNLSGWYPAGNYGVSPNATGPTVNTSADWPSPNGKTVGVKVAAPIVPRALGKLLTIGVQMIPWVGNAASIYLAVKDLGFEVSKDANGLVTYQKVDPSLCTVAPCYQYQMSGFNPALPFNGNMQAACQLMVGRSWYGAVVATSNASSSNPAAGACSGTYNGGSSFGSSNMTTQSRTPDAVVYLPSTEQEFIDSVASRSGWPTTANLAKGIADSLAITTPAGTPKPSLDIGTPTVTGPATSPGPSSTTNNPDGSRTVSTDTYNYTYAGDTITNNVTNNTTIYNADNSVRSVSTSTKAADKPNDPCVASPDTVGCQKLGDVPTIEKIPAKDIPVNVTSVSFAGGTGCPAPISYTMFAKAYTLSYQPMCDLMTTLRALFLATGAAAAAYIFMEGLKP